MANEDPVAVKTVGRGRCPICGEPTAMDYRPFCSGRCRDADLSRWLRGRYAIPGGQVDADEDGDDALANRAARRPAEEDGEADD